MSFSNDFQKCSRGSKSLLSFKHKVELYDDVGMKWSAAELNSLWISSVRGAEKYILMTKA
jgi:hypothetical protein